MRTLDGQEVITRPLLDGDGNEQVEHNHHKVSRLQLLLLVPMRFLRRRLQKHWSGAAGVCANCRRSGERCILVLDYCAHALQGIWVAVDEVNEVRFWGERQIAENVTHWPQGQILNRAVTLEVAQSPALGEPAVMRVCNRCVAI